MSLRTSSKDKRRDTSSTPPLKPSTIPPPIKASERRAKQIMGSISPSSSLASTSSSLSNPHPPSAVSTRSTRGVKREMERDGSSIMGRSRKRGTGAGTGVVRLRTGAEKAKQRTEGEEGEENDTNDEPEMVDEATNTVFRYSADPDTCEGDLTPKATLEGEADQRGRPCHDICHRSGHVSLLSHGNTDMNLRGLLNLLLIILVAQNARLVIENLLKYGVQIKPIAPTSLEDLIQNWPILLAVLWLHVFLAFSFLLEKKYLPRVMEGKKEGIDFLHSLLVGSNLFLVLFVPYLTVKLYKPEPISASFLLGFSVTWALKLYSFHHVMLDVRRALSASEDFLSVCGTREESHAAEKYPSSLRLSHFYQFIWMPTICFQFVYPRTPRIRWVIVARHILEMSICLVLMKVLIEQYMILIVQNTFIPPELLQKMKVVRIFAHLSERILKLSIPNLYVWLLMFVALFHHWLNVLAEITRFADRQFYHDWWNASSFGEYWRKWNLPIHNFFNRHLNKPLLRKGVSRLVSGQIIFIISALVHEYMVAVPLHVGWTGLIFTAFLAQIPLMYLTSLKIFQLYPTIGNVLFWISFCFTGQPLAVIIYYYLWGVQQGSYVEVNVHQLQKLILV